jgi:DNA-binding transcriptional MerR regulator
MQVANILKCSPENVRALEKKGVLHALRIGAGVRQRLFDREEVEKVARERGKQAVDGDEAQ